MVVFSSIINEGYINIGSERLLCVFNKNYDACNYGVTVGVACFLGSLCFLVLDVLFPSLSSVRDRRRVVLLDLAFSGTHTHTQYTHTQYTHTIHTHTHTIHTTHTHTHPTHTHQTYDQ